VAFAIGLGADMGYVFTNCDSPFPANLGHVLIGLPFALVNPGALALIICAGFIVIVRWLFPAVTMFLMKPGIVVAVSLLAALVSAVPFLLHPLPGARFPCDL
jgi:hypothetical protein